MRVGFEDAPGGSAPLDEAVAKAKTAQEESTRATRESAEEEARLLAAVEAQYGKLGPAAVQAYGRVEGAAQEARRSLEVFGRAAKEGGEGAAKSAREAALAISRLETEIAGLRAAGADVTLLERQLASLRTELKETAAAAGAVALAFRAADGAVASFETQAKKSVRGAALAATSAKVEIEQLAAETRRLREAGRNVEAYEVKLKELEQRYRAAERAAANFRRAQKDVDDEFRAATIRAGEVEGQITNLTDAMILQFPKAEQAILKFGASLAVLRTAYAETRQFVAFMKDTFGVDIDEAVKQSIGGWLEMYDRLLGRTLSVEEAQIDLANKVKILAAAQIEHGDSVAEVEAAYARLTSQMQLQRVEITKDQEAFKKLLETAAGTSATDFEAGVQQLVNVLESFGGAVGRFGEATPKAFDDVLKELSASPSFPTFLEKLKQLDQQLGVLREGLGKSLVGEAKDSFEAAADAFDQFLRPVLQSVPGLAADAVAALARFGIETPRDVSRAVDSLLGFQAAVQASGRVTTEQAEIIAKEARRIVAAIDQMPAAQRIAFAETREALEGLASSISGFADVALKEFGVQTPEAIDRSIVAVEGLIDAFGPLGKVTAEQAEIVVGALQKILDSIAALPEAQRLAMADQEKSIRTLADQYGEIAVRRKQYAEDIIAAEEKQLAREKEIIEQRKELLSTFAATFEQLQQKLNGKQGDGGAEQVAKLKEELAGLEALPTKTLDQVNRMAELEMQIGKAAAASLEFGKSQDQASLSVGEVDDAIKGLIDSLKQTEGGFNNLPLASRAAIENMVGRLQQAAQEGTATGRTLNDVFLTVGQIIEDAGGSLGDLGTAIDRSAEGTLNLRREFGELEAGIQATADATEGLGEKQKDAATLAKERSEAAIRAAEAETAAMENLRTATEKTNEAQSSLLSNAERLLEVSIALKECWASTSM